MKKLLLATAICGTPVFAATPLWTDLELGMSKEQVLQKHPTLKTDLGGDCEGTIKPIYKSDSLTAVVLAVKPTPKDGLGGRRRCAEQIAAGLVAKYGAPSSTTSESANPKLFKLGSESSYWQNGNIRIQLRVEKGNNLTSVVYEGIAVDARQTDTSKL
jgi:hypothetical protein